MKAFIIGIIIVVILGVGGYVIFRSPSKADTANTRTSTTTQSPSTDTSTTKVSSSATITFDGSKFSPDTLTVPSGTVLTLKNTSSTDVQMDSDPHPVHTDDTDLNVGLVASGQSKTFTVTKTGTFGFHDHLDQTIQGKITIQ